MMKKITSLFILLLTFGFGYGQTTLYEGDIAITGVNSDAPDQFSFVLLTDVLSGTIVHFADAGWLTTGGFRGYNPSTGNINSEGYVTWTAPSDLSCGTVIVVTDTGSNIHSTTTNGVLDSPTSVIETDAGFNIRDIGDQILIFQGTPGSPTFLYAVHFASSTGWTNATDPQTSAVPAGLTEGVNAIDLGNNDNSNYLCTVTNDQTLIFNAITDVNTTNWYQTNSNTGANRPVLGGCTYTCTAAGTCSSTVTWNGTWSGTPDLSTEVIIAANYDTSSGSFSACSLMVNTGIDLNVSNGTYIEVDNDVIVDGNLTVQTQGNFVQNDNSGSFTVNGTSSVTKTTPLKTDWYYYTYWSSPVVGETIGNVFFDVDADRRFWFNAANFLDTDGDDIDDNDDDWQYALSGAIMTPGVGYATTSGRLGVYPSTRVATFTGAFNTGNINASISYNAANVVGSWNFIGNPYPSAIDFIAFQQANSSVIDGAAYFWSQSLPPNDTNPGNQGLNFNQNDYATFTVGTGGAAGASGIIPDQYIPSGQGFFISGLANGTVTFTNAMRMADTSSNSQFFKGQSNGKSNIEENRLWLDLTSDNGVFNQILVGYVDGASNADDGLVYDAPRIINQDFAAVAYSLIEGSDKKYVVQGKEANSIDLEESFKLGFKTSIDVATTYTLSIAQFEGNFLSSNPVYLKDSLTNTIHNLSDSDYSFTSEVGEFNDRFEVAFSAAALSNEDFEPHKNTIKILQLDDSNIQFTTENSTFKSIEIFDLLGRSLYQLKGENNSESYNLSTLTGSVYIANIQLSNGTTVSKKFVKK